MSHLSRIQVNGGDVLSVVNITKRQETSLQRSA
jgi:hypothetical protein